MRFAAYTVFVFVMMVCATIIVVPPHIGLGENEQFFLYRALGISRGHALPVPLFLIVIAIVYGILSSGIKRQPSQTLVVATIFQLSRDLRDTYPQLFEKGHRRFSFNDFVASVAIALAMGKSSPSPFEGRVAVRSKIFSATAVGAPRRFPRTGPAQTQNSA